MTGKTCLSTVCSRTFTGKEAGTKKQRSGVGGTLFIAKIRVWPGIKCSPVGDTGQLYSED